MRAEEHERPHARTVRLLIPPRTGVAIVVIGVATVVALWALTQVWQVIVTVVVALVLAGTLSPLVDAMERHRVPRGIALALTLLLLIGALVGIGFLIIPALAGQVAAIVANAPHIQERIAAYAARFPPLAGRAESIRNARPEQFLAPLQGAFVTYARSVVEFVTYLVTTVALAFYLIADRERVRGFLFALIPRRHHVRTAGLLRALETIVGGYVRGQALTSLMIGGFVYLLMLIMHAPNALMLGVFAGLADLIPYIGPVLATVPPVLVVLPQGIARAAIVLVVLVLYEEFESRIVIPRVYGHTLRLSPVAVTVALLAGGKLFGVIGALLALPIAAGIRATVEQLRITLPGDESPETAEEAREERATARYLRRTEGVPAVEAADLATEVADRLEDDREERTGKPEIPVEKQPV